ncbi:MAG: protein translocase subunit SecF [Alphaproteobacteria bacterium]|nr:MAG: protein translocase subunit SecF [Alphaproteobacteria bacterium]
MRGVRLFSDTMNLNFMRLRFIGAIISAVIILGTIGLLLSRGLNFGIDFTGGMMIEIQVEPAPNLQLMRRDLNALDLGDISIQEFGSPNDVLIRVPQQDGGADAQKAAEQSIRDALNGVEDSNVDYRRVEFVGPQVGDELIEAGLYAVIFSILGIMAYVSFRFEWQFGAAAIFALLHDVLAIIGFFVITQKQFDLATVAAILTIAGYSINDTVVIFDRIRENVRKFKKMPLEELINKSLNETLSRTILTSVTTMLALGALWLFGGEVIRGFVDALMVGVMIGTYSTLFIATPALLRLGVKRTSE